jgi:large subunit ribosomal protein L35Ae
MQGIISSFRRSIKVTSHNHMIVIVDGVTKKEEAAKLVGKKVIYNTGKKDISGKIAAAHGKSGAVRVIFETGMPGQSQGQKVTVQ